MIELSKIKPYIKNAKKHSATQINNMIQSIKEFGFVQPIVVDCNNVIIIGHCRYLALKKIGYDKVPLDWIKKVDISETEANKLRLLDNKLNESEWDFDLLSEQILDIDFSDYNIDFKLSKQTIEIQEYENIETNNKINIKNGDMWELGYHRIMCGDSTNKSDVEKLLNGKEYDFCFFDPDYNEVQLYDYIPDNNGKRLGVMYDMYRCDYAMKKALDKGWIFNYELLWDCVTSWYSDNRPLARHKGIFIFGDNKSWDFDNAIIVDGKKRKISKGNNGRGNYECKPLDGATHLSTVYSYPNPKLNDEHGYGKPIKWIAAIINGVNANLIFDMFAGSGNILFACEQLNKICYSMDINSDYIAAIINKWEKITGKKAKKI